VNALHNGLSTRINAVPAVCDSSSAIFDGVDANGGEGGCEWDVDRFIHWWDFVTAAVFDVHALVGNARSIDAFRRGTNYACNAEIVIGAIDLQVAVAARSAQGDLELLC